MANHKRDKINSLSRNSLFPFTSILSPGGRGKGEGVSSERGVALIAAVLAVVILMVIGLSFAFNMRLEEKAAVNFMNNVRAKQIAQAGIDRAIAELRNHANNHAYFCLVRFPQDFFVDEPLGDGTYTVRVIDTASRIYLNHDSGSGPGATTLDEMLEALDGIGPTRANNIITHRNSWPGDIFITKEQVKGTTGIGQATYNQFRDDITVDTWVNPATGRAPVNVNTASEEVLEAVLWPLLAPSSPSPPIFSSTGDHDTLAKAIIARRQGPLGPFTTWRDFNDFIYDQSLYLDITERDIIKDNCNPNSGKTTSPPHGFTTEFSFNSGGYFEIESTGRVYDLAGAFAAESKIRAVVNTFGIWHQTTRAQFAANTLRAVDAATRFYRVDYYDAAQLAHLLVETEEDSDFCLYFNFSYMGYWEVGSGGFPDNPFNPPTPDYRRRDDFVNPDATCQWNFAITDAMGLSGGTYDVFAWWYMSSNNTIVFYERQIGDGTVYFLASGEQWWSPPPPPPPGWNRLTWLPLSFPVETTTPSFIRIQGGFAISTMFSYPPSLSFFSIADAMLLAAVDGVPGGYAGTMTAELSFPVGEQVRLGTIAWTPIIPANTGITFEAGIYPVTWPVLGPLTDPAGNPLSGTGNIISFRAYFSRDAGLPTPADPPILDDVTITYLPRTRILYWREVTE